uniref:Uncharacterized protein n=1 Tax=Oryza barthii TaxID=65489 RepID=A0A0D3GXG5_9ORYZ
MPFIEKLRRRCAVATSGSHRRQRCDATAIRQFEEDVAPCLLQRLKVNRELSHTLPNLDYNSGGDGESANHHYH